MKKIISITALAALFAVPAALAQDSMTFSSVDANSDSYVSLVEVQAVNAGITVDTFAIYDTDADARLSKAEFDAWKDTKAEKDDGMDPMQKEPRPY